MTPNKQQQDVINHVDGPCLVTAVPGSGKTASVTERTKNLIRLGKDPSSILAITFTNKAAKEMRERIAKAVGSDAELMTVSTFHSLCARILRENADKVGLRENFTIYDADEQERLLKTCTFRVEGEDFKVSDWYERAVMSYVEGRRNACLSHAQAVNRFKVTPSQVQVIAEYFKSIKAANAIDFTGLLSETIKLFEKNPDVLEAYRARWLYVSVDEVQDTNVAQYSLVKLLVGGHRNVLMVGDLDQSIYRFRNAAPENILEFEKDFSPVKILKLEKNYRSTPQILKHSQNLIEKNKLRKGTKLETDNCPGEPPRIMHAMTDEDMASKIAEDVRRRIKGGLKASEVAILYRANHVSRVLELALRVRGVKYRVLGGQSFYDRKEVKGCLAILKLIANQSDPIAFEKCCELCCKGAGPKTINLVIEAASQGSCSVMRAAKNALDDPGSPHGAKALEPLVRTFVEAKGRRADQALLHIAKGTCLWERMEEDSTDSNDRCGNIEEMARDVEKFMSSPGSTLSGYLQNVALLSATDDDEPLEEVKLMTLHSCKGLEFDAVYISHVNAGLIPHSRCVAVEDPKERGHQIEEERRLLYVGMTRARKHLTLAFCWAVGRKESEPSTFLYETGLSVPSKEEVDIPKKKWLGQGRY